MSSNTIMIVEDDERLLRALTVRLENAGYEVATALDAVGAVNVARRIRPDLLLLDVNVPAGDGFTIQERVRSLENLHEVPVIYLTGERSTRVSYGSREMGARAVFYKPLDVERLLVCIAEALGDSGSLRTKCLDDLQRAADQWTAGRLDPGTEREHRRSA